jgi:hypothetical protein
LEHEPLVDEQSIEVWGFFTRVGWRKAELFFSNFTGGKEMSHRKIVSFGLVVGVAALLNGCAPNAGVVRQRIAPAVTVKSIKDDPESYLSRNFTASSLPDELLRTVSNLDTQPVGFGRLELDTTVSGTRNGVDGVSHYTNHGIYQSEGNGLVRGMDTLSSNGIQMSIEFDVTYRNLQTLRSQNVPLNAINADHIIATHTLSHMDVPSYGLNRMSFSYDYGYQGLSTKFVHGETNCVFGSEFSASDISPKIAGRARNLDCEASNSNGVVTSKTHIAYLDTYGFAIILKRSNSAGTTSFTVDDFKVL